MKRRKDRRAYSQTTVNTVILVFIIVAFVYLGVQISKNFSFNFSTLRTQSVADSQYVYLKGYVFRDESALTMNERGVVDFLFRDGERVGVDQTYAVYYPMPSLSDDEVAAKQSELNALNEGIRRFDGGITGGMIADLAGVNTDLTSSYYAYIDAILDGDLVSADKKGELMLDALVEYSIITGKGDTSSDIPKQLKERKAQLLSSLGVNGQNLSTNDGMYLYYTADGYESIYSIDKLEELTPSGLRQLTQSSPKTYSSNTVGRIVRSPKWYMAIPTDEATALRFSEGAVYTVGYSGNSNKTVDMNLEKICVDENGDAYLLFASFDLAVSEDVMRAQNVKILMSSVSGYRIPTEAIHNENGNDGVYILVGTVVEFRRVNIVKQGNGYCLVSTYEEDLANNPDSSVPYLNANDLIITSGNDLYDGKLID